MKRIFAAIKIQPDEVFNDIYYQLKSQLKNEKIKWVALEKMHITLKFFGETEESRIAPIIDLLDDISNHHSSFSLNIKNVGIFGSSYNPRVIWFGLDKAELLVNLANDVLNKVESLGFERGRQNFVPHLTVGRIKYLDNKQRFQEIDGQYKTIDIQQQQVDQFSLIESTLTPQGPI